MHSKLSNDAFVILSLIVYGIENIIAQNETRGIENDLLEYYPGQTPSFIEFTKKYGYISEEHTVVTEDGYILTVFRITKGKKCFGPVRRPPVLLMHGLLLGSDSWIDAGPSSGLAFLISDACYDIWIGNVRGNYYGRRHVRYNPDTDSRFWNFSNDEMGTFDVPAIIKYISNETSSVEILYIGFSQGSRILYIMCSETYGYCDKIKVFISLAPAVRFNYSRSSFVGTLVKYFAYMSSTNEMEVLKRGSVMQKLVSSVCKFYVFAGTVCKAIIPIIDSYNAGSVSTKTVSVLFDHFPDGTSARNLAIYGQNFLSKKFQKFDYGARKNMELYGSHEPPLYDLNRTTTPVVLIYGKNDFLVDPKDVSWLSKQLPNLLELYQVKSPMWNHFDNNYSRNVKRLIFPKINQYLKMYSEVVT